MAGWPSIHVVCFGVLVLVAPVGAQQAPPTRAAQAAPSIALSQRQTVPSVVGLTVDSAQRALTFRKLIPQIETRPRGLRSNTQDVVTQQSPAAGQPVPANRTVVVEVTIVMPNVVGQNLARARELLASRGIKVNYATQEAVGTTSDVIIRQSPPAGQVVSTSLTADLTGAIEVIRVPDVRGLTVAPATNRLARFVVRAESAPNAAAPNTIFQQDPAPFTPARPGSTVTVYVAQDRVLVPAVLTLTEADAKQQIAASGLRVATVEPRDDAATPGTVIDQSPAARTPVQRGSDVSIVVARQAPPVFVVVPNFIGRRVDSARRTLDSAGLQLGLLRGVADTSTGRVAAQSAAAGSRVAPNTRVDLDTTIARAIVSLVVTPERAELRAGDTVRFTAIATMSDGTRTRARATWSATAGGTIASDGVFTAGADSGSYAITATDAAGVATGTARVRVTAAGPPPPPPVVVPDIVGLSRAQARAVASRAGFALVVAPGQSARDGDVVVAQTPLARTTVSRGSLVLMAQFGTAPPPARPWWILWVALGIAAVAAAALLFRRRPPTSTTPPIAPPPITYAPGVRPPSFSITEGKTSRGLELSLSMQNDPGVQAVIEPSKGP